MGQMLEKDEIEELASWLESQTSDRILSKAGRLIDLLQARSISEAREIAAELSNDLDRVGTSETRSALSELSDLLESDAVFDNCDRPSYLLLDLEHRLSAPVNRSVEFCRFAEPIHSFGKAPNSIWNHVCVREAKMQSTVITLPIHARLTRKGLNGPCL